MLFLDACQTGTRFIDASDCTTLHPKWTRDGSRERSRGRELLRMLTLEGLKPFSCVPADPHVSTSSADSPREANGDSALIHPGEEN